MSIEDHAAPEVVAAPPVEIPVIPEPTAAAPAEPVENAEKPAQATEPDANAAEDAKQKGIQKRIDRLTREKYEAKARADLLEQMITQRPAPQQANAQDGRPKKDAYASDEDFVEALTDWKLSQREQASRAQEAQRAQQSAAEKTRKIFSAAEELGNFDRDEFAEKVRVTDVMADAILDSDVGAKLLVHLNTNPDEAERIANLPPARQAAEIGKLEAKLSTVTPKVSKAPPPIDPIGGGKAAVVDLGSASMDEYIAMRKKQGARWAR